MSLKETEGISKGRSHLGEKGKSMGQNRSEEKNRKDGRKEGRY